jgi:hypothetical protein
MKKRTFLGLMAATPVTMLAGCGGNSDGDAKIRLINVNPSYSAVSMTVDDDSKVSSLAYGSVSGFSDISSGSVDIVVKVASSTTELASKSYSTSSDKERTVVLYGWAGDDAELYSYVEDEDTPDSGESSLALFNATVDVGSLDVYLTATDEDLDSAPTFGAALSSGDSAAHKTVDSATYRLRVTAAGDTSDVRLDTSVTLSSQKIYTLILSAGSSGVLVHAHLLQQGGGATALLNTQARVRVIPAVANHGVVSLSLYNQGTKVTEVPLDEIKSPTPNPYVLVDAGTVTVTTKVDGSAANATGSFTLAAGTDTTFVVTGTSARDAALITLTDNNRPAASNKFKLRVVHAEALLASDTVNVTIDGVSTSGIKYLGSSGSLSSGVWSSGYVSRASGTDQDVFVETQTTEIYSASTDDFSSKCVYTAFVWDKGGTPDVKFVADRTV